MGPVKLIIYFMCREYFILNHTKIKMESQFNAIPKGDISLNKKVHATKQEYIACIGYIHDNEPITFEQLWTFISLFELTKSQKIDLINEILNSTLVLCKNWIFFMR